MSSPAPMFSLQNIIHRPCDSDSLPGVVGSSDIYIRRFTDSLTSFRVDDRNNIGRIPSLKNSINLEFPIKEEDDDLSILKKLNQSQNLSWIMYETREGKAKEREDFKSIKGILVRKLTYSVVLIYLSRYSRKDQVKFVEDSL